MNRIWARLVSPWHDGPHECAVTKCDLPGCGAKRGACCVHCPADYRRKQGEK